MEQQAAIAHHKQLITHNLRVHVHTHRCIKMQSMHADIIIITSHIHVSTDSV